MPYPTLITEILATLARGGTQVREGELFYEHLLGEPYQFSVKLYSGPGRVTAVLPDIIAVGVFDRPTCRHHSEQSLERNGAKCCASYVNDLSNESSRQRIIQ